MENCPCDPEKTYESCCEPYHLGQKGPLTAELLMRSRYSAFAKAKIDYLHETYHPHERESHDKDATKDWAENSEWLGLEIKDIKRGGPDDDEGMVEFIAKYKVKNKQMRHHEISDFKKLDGKWYFVDGRMMGETYVRETQKVGRNDPCVCGSGKKYKKCCGS